VPLALLLMVVLAITATVAGTATPAQAAAKPGPVGSVAATGRIAGGKANVQLTWPKAKGARSYQVLWSTSPAMRKPHKAGVRKRSYTVRGLALGRTWCFQVRGVNGRKLGPRSAAVCRRVDRVGQASPVWVHAQQLRNGRVDLTVRWPRVAGATSYELDYRQANDLVVQAAGKATQRVPSSGTGAEQETVVPNLLPNRTYCFQVRGMGGGGPGLRSQRHCKVTMPADRGPVANPLDVDVTSWNICAVVSGCHSWAARRDGIAKRIRALGSDLVAIQEAGMNSSGVDATADLNRLVSADYGVGCTSGLGRDRIVYYKKSTYRVVPSGSSGDTIFKDGSGRYVGGACWVTVADLATDTPITIASLHLKVGSTNADDDQRRAEAAQLVRAIGASAGQRVLLVGDFNSSRSRPTDKAGDYLVDIGMRDSYDIAARYDSKTHYASAHGWGVVAGTTTMWGAHVDRVFSTAGIHVASWRVAEPMSGGRYTDLLSDHGPLQVALQVPIS
jgi:endonuclease/exonuclease/phosphatase family metal-dependent hydrolase